VTEHLLRRLFSSKLEDRQIVAILTRQAIYIGEMERMSIWLDLSHGFQLADLASRNARKFFDQFMSKRHSMNNHFCSASMPNIYMQHWSIISRISHSQFHCHPRNSNISVRTSYHLVSRLIRTNPLKFPFVYSICYFLVPIGQRSQFSIICLSRSNSGKTTERG
jgi:hypothetical protein